MEAKTYGEGKEIDCDPSYRIIRASSIYMLLYYKNLCGEI